MSPGDEEVDLILEIAPLLQENRTGRFRELLQAAIALIDELLKQKGMTPAEAMGPKGGTATAQKNACGTAINTGWRGWRST